jgi:hypothetical protein
MNNFLNTEHFSYNSSQNNLNRKTKNDPNKYMNTLKWETWQLHKYWSSQEDQSKFAWNEMLFTPVNYSEYIQNIRNTPPPL